MCRVLPHRSCFTACQSDLSAGARSGEHHLEHVACAGPPGDQGTRGCERQVLLTNLIPFYDSRDEGKAGDVYVDFSQAFVAVCPNIAKDKLLRAWVCALLIG